MTNHIQHNNRSQPHHHHNNQQPQQRRANVDLRVPAIEKYAYCLCLHVKPTTIFIAVFKLINALLSASVLLNSEFTVADEQIQGVAPLILEDRYSSTTAAVNILARIIIASVSAVGIYSVIIGRSALLMPLYAILLVEFFFSLPAFSNRELDPAVEESIVDFRNNYTSGPNPFNKHFLMFTSTITTTIKIYFLCVIWKCYRYLRLIELVRLSEIYPHIHEASGGSRYPIVRVVGNTNSTDLSGGPNVAPPPYESISSSMKPPNYEEAMKSSNLGLAFNPTTNPQQQQQQQTVVFTTEQTHTGLTDNLSAPTTTTATVNPNNTSENSLQLDVITSPPAVSNSNVINISNISGVDCSVSMNNNNINDNKDSTLSTSPTTMMITNHGPTTENTSNVVISLNQTNPSSP